VILAGKPEGEIRRRWKNNIKEYLKETGCGKKRLD
jgi:hypothetical protein